VTFGSVAAVQPLHIIAADHCAHPGGAMTKQLRILMAETVGTFVLIMGGPGTAVLATGRFFPNGSVQVLGVALAFGLSLLVMAYAIGNISGCHINPAVTIGLWITRKIESGLVAFYFIGQFVGAALGGLVIWLIATGAPGPLIRTPRTSR
jgi:aquaporin Z